MDWSGRIRSALSHLDRLPDDDIIEELAQHARATYESARAEGLDTDRADRRVDECVAEWCRQAAALNRPARHLAEPVPPPAESGSRWRGLAQDLHYAMRRLRRRPRVAVMVALTMALGIGPAAALFNVVYGVLIKPLPWPSSARVVVLKETRGGNEPRFGSFSNATYLAWREQPSAIDEIAAWSSNTMTISGAADPERVRLTSNTASLFRALDVKPLIGSLFGDADEREHVIVLSERLWRRRFAADPAIVGAAIQLDGVPFVVRGVTPDAASYPDRQSLAWIPFDVRPATNNLLMMFEAVARLKPGSSIEAAMAEGAARGAFAADTGGTTVAIFGKQGAVRVAAKSLDDALIGDVRRPLVILMIAVSLLLVIAVTNIVSLQLADGASRRRELALRSALGANSSRVTGQLAAESLLIGVAGATLSLVTAWALQRGAAIILPIGFPRAPELRFDDSLMLFAIAAATIATFAIGLVPAVMARRTDLVGSLGEDGAAPAGAGIRTAASRSRVLIVGGQIALACMMLVVASLLVRSFLSALKVDRGYDPAKVQTAALTMSGSGYTPDRRIAVLASMVARIAASPSVEAAAFASEQPFTPGGSTSAMQVTPAGGGTPVMVQASPRQVSPGYFDALGLRVVSGRGLNETDSPASEPVTVVNETLARKYFPNGALGAQIPMGIWGGAASGTATIVGVVQDVRYVGATVTSLPELYFSYRQLPVGLRSSTATLLIRGGGDSPTLANSLRSIVRETDASASLGTVMTIEDRLLATSLARPRLYAMLLAAFACVALAVTGIGLFGAISYAMAQRGRELALRSALGASRRDLLRAVLSQGMGAVFAGLLLGLAGARWVAGLTSTVLFGVTANDTLTYVSVPLMILLVALIACIGPARRAWRIDPIGALRGR